MYSFLNQIIHLIFCLIFYLLNSTLSVKKKDFIIAFYYFIIEGAFAIWKTLIYYWPHEQ